MYHVDHDDVAVAELEVADIVVEQIVDPRFEYYPCAAAAAAGDTDECSSAALAFLLIDADDDSARIVARSAGKREQLTEVGPFGYLIPAGQPRGSPDADVYGEIAAPCEYIVRHPASGKSGRLIENPVGNFLSGGDKGDDEH